MGRGETRGRTLSETEPAISDLREAGAEKPAPKKVMAAPLFSRPAAR
jgi:hypothetical protein